MIGVRVKKAHGHGWHWLNDNDPGRTLCGKPRIGLAVELEEERERLPATEACVNCLRNADGWAKPLRDRAGLPPVMLPPSHGTLRTTGPLNHGVRSRSARRLG